MGRCAPATGLTATGYCWAVLSTAAALACAVGFYMPYWLVGLVSPPDLRADGDRAVTLETTSFGSFRRCNYPLETDDGKLGEVLSSAFDL